MTLAVWTCSHALSGGQKRKLNLAMALIGGSKVILLDEVSGFPPFVGP
jgi:ABC-type multidrug transport system ATPase subunit